MKNYQRRKPAWKYPDKGGFTLLEVLVALAILAIAMGALIMTSSNNAKNAAYIQEKTFAHWVAMNMIFTTQMAEEWPDTGFSEGEYEMAGNTWRWSADIENTEDENVRRIEVTVKNSSDHDAEPVAALVGYTGRTARRGFE